MDADEAGAANGSAEAALAPRQTPGGDAFAQLLGDELRHERDDGEQGGTALVPEEAATIALSADYGRTPFDQPDDDDDDDDRDVLGGGSRLALQSPGDDASGGTLASTAVKPKAGAEVDAVREASLARSERIRQRDLKERQTRDKLRQEARAEWARMHKQWAEARDKSRAQVRRRQEPLTRERETLLQTMEKNARSGRPNWNVVRTLSDIGAVKVSSRDSAPASTSRSDARTSKDEEVLSRASRARMKEVINACARS
ncbi:hypothetical protein CDCA_CDCA06G1824 [Cyanidium caldarium]|uniref:Clathrin light chain n=1 Tax=Cyanidium caldarium TaxID=2771 RepID=A0AAV9IU37_CYACA|nr:hypothetical protein CDCA_CDCA06G1824 [Cyanidium caldarium]